MALSTIFAITAMIATTAMALFMVSDAQERAGNLGRALTRAHDELAGRQTEAGRRDQLRAICDLLPMGVVLLDAMEHVLICNRHAATILQRDGGGVSTLEHLTVDPEVLASVRQALHQRRTATGAIASDPGRFVEIIAHPLEDGETLVVLQDVSELRLLRTVRRDFVANVSHELRTPLASIRLLVDTLEDGALEEAEVAAGFIHRIGVEADHLIQMVTELLALSRIESGQLPIHREPVSMPPLIQDTVDRLNVVAQDKGINVFTEMQAEMPPALADRDQVEQVLLNLLFNAIKFTPSEGQVRIRATAQDGHITVAISDTGMGIPRKDLARVFERFYKSDKSRARSGGGTGLGLPIARHIVESHGGSIWADSEEGQGSTFTFTLPTA